MSVTLRTDESTEVLICHRIRRSSRKAMLLRGCNAAISVAVEKFQELTSTSHPLQSLQILLNWPWSQPLYHWVLGQGEEILCTKIKDQRCMKCECYQGYLLNQEASVSIHSQRQLMLFLWVQEARWFSGLQVAYCRLSCWKAAQWHTTHSLNLDNLPEVTDYILRSIYIVGTACKLGLSVLKSMGIFTLSHHTDLLLLCFAFGSTYGYLRRL